MSSTHSTLQHPFLSHLGLHHKAGQQDALNNCASVLAMLADLFGSDTTSYPVLDSDAARRGMWINLVGIADTLTAIGKALDSQ